MRSAYDYLAGLFMGVASLLPSFSAGTAAVIANRYTLLLSLIDDWRTIVTQPFENKATLIRGVSLGLGGVTALIFIAPLIEALLSTAMNQVLSFFVGLIMATTLFFLPTQVETRDMKTWIAVITGVAIVTATRLVSAQIELTAITAPFLAIIAVTAMLLPGVSGSYMLLVVGAYQAMITAITHPVNNAVVLTVFAVTAIAYAEFTASTLRSLIEQHTRPAYHIIFGMLLAGATLILLDTDMNATTAVFAVLGVATYPALTYIQTNKRG